MRIAIAAGTAAAISGAATLGLAALVGGSAAFAASAVALGFFSFRSLSRVPPRLRPAQLLVMAMVAGAATAVGRVLITIPALGAALFALAAAATVWGRRFGPRGRRIAMVAATPFVSVLTVPVPPVRHGGALGPLALTAVSVLTAAIVIGVLAVAERLPPRARPITEAPARPRRAGAGPLTGSDRMAVQMLVGISAAFAAGFLLFPGHWAWAVLTAYIALIGGNGRGEVVITVLLRVAGAAAGAVVGEAAGSLVAGSPVLAIVVVLVVLSIGAGLRTRSYTWWAAAVTTALAIFGRATGGAPAVLVEREAAILVGGALAGSAAWFVLPVRTRAMLRLRAAGQLAAVGDALRVLRESPEYRADALHEVDIKTVAVRDASRAYRLHGRVRRRGSPGAMSAALLLALPDALRSLSTAPVPDRELTRLERRTGTLRRVIRGDDIEPDSPLEPDDSPAGRLRALLHELREPLSSLR